MLKLAAVIVAGATLVVVLGHLGAGIARSSHPTAQCSRTLHPDQAGDIGDVLRSARGGAVICLAPGVYGGPDGVEIAGVSPTSPVTLRPIPGHGARLTGLALRDSTHNLTIRGFSLGPVSVTGSASELQFIYNNIQHATSGFYFSASPGNVQTGIRVSHNRMAHLVSPSLGGVATAQCVTIAGGATEERHFTVSHNVCGPDIGDHYFQVGGIDGLVADYNTFLGPPNSEIFSQGAHNNVLQVFADADNVEFSHNVIRNTESRGQTVLIEEGHFENIRIDDNLWQEAPICLVQEDCHSYAIQVYNAHGLSFSNNTVIGSYWGVILTTGESQSWPTGENYTITHNIVVGTRDNRDLSFLGCTSNCVFDYNVTDDGSSRQGGSQHHVARWRPRFRDTTWYEPIGLRFPAGFRR
jgi:hypothetical protein